MVIWNVRYQPVNDMDADIPEIDEDLGDFPALLSDDAIEEASEHYDIHTDDLTVKIVAFT